MVLSFTALSVGRLRGASRRGTGGANARQRACRDRVPARPRVEACPEELGYHDPVYQLVITISDKARRRRGARCAGWGGRSGLRVALCAVAAPADPARYPALPQSRRVHV
ncbi:MAG: hypothetical protein WKH64_13645 [Chloroflexia bacterium]